ncbi:MAG: 30S ribosomal protein S21 [Acholeplasmatales bacterium]|nr:30S ribosomal protein S21 [Acholeplasmatales bacterium]
MVRLREGESTESLIKRFKRDYAKSGILQDFRKHECFQSPSEKKREKRERNARMRQKFARKAKEY